MIWRGTTIVRGRCHHERQLRPPAPLIRTTADSALEIAGCHQYVVAPNKSISERRLIKAKVCRAVPRNHFCFVAGLVVPAHSTSSSRAPVYICSAIRRRQNLPLFDGRTPRSP